MSPWAFRTPNDRVDCDALLRLLSPAAELKQAPWDWSILACQKARRSQGPDLHSLRETYYDLLDKLLDVAPGGFPPLVSLRQVWMELHREHGIQPKSDIQSLHAWANESADRCRLMMRHLVEIKRSDSSWMKVGLGPLLAKIQLPERDDTCDRPPTKARKLTTMCRLHYRILWLCVQPVANVPSAGRLKTLPTAMTRLTRCLQKRGAPWISLLLDLVLLRGCWPSLVLNLVLVHSRSCFATSQRLAREATS